MRFKKGDTVPLSYQIMDWNIDTQGNVDHDLTGQTVLFTMVKDGETTPTIYDQPCSIVDAGTGVVEYWWGAGESDESGMYRMMFKVVTAGGNIATYPEYATQWLWIVDDEIV
jgi:hypothetical protein